MTHDLRVQRVYDAAPEVVFDAFTDPRAQREMYADEPDWIVRSECDLRVGGRWTIEFGPPDGRPSREICVFEVVDRPRRLVFRSTMVLPDSSSVDTRTYVTFAGTAGGRTRLTVVQTGFPAAELRDQWTDGWGGILAGLSRVVAARTP
ncbi:MAG TPA: SRPBCC domain-containing protein [Streptosporangiaceae bacterium]|nr:SRPBCC domain-containing protein [Streptosporangiaceae bacterium]